jgi:hypothetical protein
MSLIKTNKVVLISFAIITLFLSGCSFKQDIEGEAFVDSGGTAKKLALVNIQVVPEDKFIAHIKKQLPKADEEAKRLQASILDFRQYEAKAQSLMLESAMIRMGGVSASALIDNNNAINSASAVLSEGRARASDDEAALNGLLTGSNPIYFSEKIDGAIVSTESNSEGKFKLSLESGKKVVLVAVKDKLAWAMWVTPEKSKPTITLTNKNLSGSECTNCVFNGKETPKSIAVGG